MSDQLLHCMYQRCEVAMIAPAKNVITQNTPTRILHMIKDVFACPDLLSHAHSHVQTHFPPQACIHHIHDRTPRIQHEPNMHKSRVHTYLEFRPGHAIEEHGEQSLRFLLRHTLKVGGEHGVHVHGRLAGFRVLSHSRMHGVVIEHTCIDMRFGCLYVN